MPSLRCARELHRSAFICPVYMYLSGACGPVLCVFVCVPLLCCAACVCVCPLAVLCCAACVCVPDAVCVPTWHSPYTLTGWPIQSTIQDIHDHVLRRAYVQTCTNVPMYRRVQTCLCTDVYKVLRRAYVQTCMRSRVPGSAC